jgi:hypothetical protein
MGIKMKINDRQSITKPAVGGRVPVLVMPFSSVLYGMLPVAVKAPKMHRNRPGQPHRMTEATVARMPVFLFFMLFFSLIEGLESVYNESGKLPRALGMRGH